MNNNNLIGNTSEHNLPTGWMVVHDTKGTIKYLDDKCVLHDELPLSDIEMLRKEILLLKSTIPVGTIVAFAGTKSPDGWLLCDGSGLSKQKYNKLFEVVVENFCLFSSESFYLPDLRGRIIVGCGNGIDFKTKTQLTERTIGDIGGEEDHLLTVNEMPVHGHNYTHESWIGGDGLKNGGGHGQVGFNQKHDITAERGGNKPHNNMPPFLVLNYIIKY